MADDSSSSSFAELDWAYLQWNVFRSKRYRLLYIATPKVACTSLKWWFARLEGFSKAVKHVVDSDESEPDLIIHDAFHKVAPEVTGLSPEALAELFDDDTYFKFAVVRNPYKRIFSAWQSKLMLREPLQSSPYSNQDFFHRPISTVEEIGSAFEGFLEHLEANEVPSFWDVHWTPQNRLLRPDLIKYAAIAQIENCAELGASLVAKLDPSVPSPFDVSAANESLIPFLPDFFTDRSAALIRSIYAEDFEVFKYEKALPSAKQAFSSDQFDIAIKAIAMIRGRHERMATMRLRTKASLGDLERIIHEQDSRADLLQKTLASAIEAARVEFTESSTVAVEQAASLENDLNAYRKQAETFQRLLSEAMAHANFLTQDNAAIREASSADTNGLVNQLREANKRSVSSEQENIKLAEQLADANAQLALATNELVIEQRQLDEVTQNFNQTRERVATLDRGAGSIYFTFKHLLALLVRKVTG